MKTANEQLTRNIAQARAATSSVAAAVADVDGELAESNKVLKAVVEKLNQDNQE